MGRAPYSDIRIPDVSRKPVKTVKGRVVYDRRKHEFRARDALRVVKKLGIPVETKDCQAMWELLAILLAWAYRAWEPDSIAVVAVETAKQVIFAMQKLLDERPLCWGEEERFQPTTIPEDTRPWWQRLLVPFKVD